MDQGSSKVPGKSENGDANKPAAKSQVKVVTNLLPRDERYFGALQRKLTNIDFKKLGEHEKVTDKDTVMLLCSNVLKTNEVLTSNAGRHLQRVLIAVVNEKCPKEGTSKELLDGADKIEHFRCVDIDINDDNSLELCRKNLQELLEMNEPETTQKLGVESGKIDKN